MTGVGAATLRGHALRSPSRGLRVAALTAVVGGAAVAVFHLVLAPLDPPGAALPVPWWSFALLFFLTEAFPVHIHFRSEAHSLSLSELGLVLGLYAVTPSHLLLAQLVGAAVALGAVRRQRPQKLAFNLCGFLLGSCLALLVFHGFLSFGGAYGPAGWAGALLGVLANAIAGVLLVSVVIWLAASRSTLRELPALLAVAAGGSLASASLAIAATQLAEVDARALWVLVVPTAGTALAFHAYTTERRRHEHLEFLYHSMRVMQHAPAFQSSVRELLEAARSMLAADVAEIVLFLESAEQGGLRSAITPGHEELMVPVEVDATALQALELVSAQDSAVLLPRPRQPHALDGYLAERGLDDAIVAALHGADGVLGLVAVGNRSGDVATFTKDDRKLFETFASHAGVLLENDRVKEQLRHQAFHDALTGLPNRVLFAEQVRSALGRAASAGLKAVVLFVDLDDFKTINDTMGHGAGDQVLVAVAERIRASVRPTDVAARLGGDEFAILLDVHERSGAELVAGRILDALRAPFVVEGREVPLHASIGIADAGEADSAEELLRNADVAMYSAKTNDKGGHAWYEPEMHVRIRRRQELAGSLEHAIERGEIDVHYQPIVALASSGVVAVEALARWHHPVRGLLPPDAFIPLAEETGLMPEIGAEVLRRACEQLRTWSSIDGAHADLAVAVNLSLSELRNPDLVPGVERVLAETGLAPERLILEITETIAMENPPATIGTLTELRRLGVRLALDDFGTGYSSLSHLRDFPIDILKIAKPFVDRIARDGGDGTFVDAILRLADALDLDVVAEGIERRDQVDALRRVSCGLGQGFYFSRPVDAVEMGARLVRPKPRRRPKRRLRVA